MKHKVKSIFVLLAMGCHELPAALPNEATLALFQPLPEEADSAENKPTEATIKLGRMLYFETRISKGGKMSCNTCHPLASYGQDNLPFSPGHEGKLGGRSSPSTYNAALHLSQFWDGRAPNVEEQSKGPVLNPVEMGMPNAEAVVAVLKSIPGYTDAFKAAFPGEMDPMNFDNFGKAVGAFERRLVTPSRWDDYLKGRPLALTAEEVKGFETFVKTGCATCHNGPAVGGASYQKLGLVKAWLGLKDAGRFDATKRESDRYFFKVPSLRNVTETGPYLHDGSVKSLEETISRMGEYQLGKALSADEVSGILTYLKTLKGDLPRDYISPPRLPESGPNTPKF